MKSMRQKMSRLQFNAVLFLLVTISSVSAEVGHPRIYGTEDTRAQLQEKIQNYQWAQAVFNSIRSQVDPYVELCRDDPNWISSRLQMHWRTHYTHTYVNGSVWSHGSGRGPVPTPRFAGGRDWAVDYASPALKDIIPYTEDERGLYLQNMKKDGRPWEWTDPDQTGQIIERINEKIMDLAAKAAFLYWFTGQEGYAEFASNILWTYMHGMYYRNNPEFYQDDRSAGIVGLATFEVIHEAITKSIAVAYDYLYDYLIAEGRDVSLIQDVLKRWTDRIIEGGGAQGNWNINQARYIVYMGLTLEDNDQYADGKGRQYYLAQFLTESTPNQKCLRDVVPDEYEPESGIWAEAPGYAFGTTNTILQLAEIIENQTDQNILRDYPVLVQAAMVVCQYLFPNGLTVGFGDTYHDKPDTSAMELLIARFRRNGNVQAERQVTHALNQQIKLNGYDRSRNNSLLALTTYVGQLRNVGNMEEPLATRTFFGRPVNLLIQRSGDDVENGMMISLVGTEGGHVHSNGMAMELYGRSMVIAPDGGRGSSYWQKEHGQYYSRYPAHNTVIVDGISDYHAHNSRGTFKHAFEISAVEPAPQSQLGLSDKVSFSDTRFNDYRTEADQRRLLSIVRTSPETGYYVDIFRSRKRQGGDGKHEYLYHGVGQSIDVVDTVGNNIQFNPTDQLGTDHGDQIGYNYFTDKYSAIYEDDFWAVFKADLSNADNVRTRMWMNGQSGRELFRVMAPKSRAAGRGALPREIAELPLPTMIIRQNGEAWQRPFAAVYEPYRQSAGPSIRGIRPLQTAADGDFVGFAVQSINSQTQYILNNTDGGQTHNTEGITFAGIYGIISQDDSGMEYLYLGSGTYISKDGFAIDGNGDTVSACVYRDNGQWYYSTDKSISVSLALSSGDSQQIRQLRLKLPPAQRAVIPVKE